MLRIDDLRTVDWVGGIKGAVKLIDQTLLPARLHYLTIKDVETLREAICSMRVRGAPAIGVAAAMGVVLGVRDARVTSGAALVKEVERVAAWIRSARPTAVNLAWAVERMVSVARASAMLPPEDLLKLLLDEAKAIAEEDREMCRRIGLAGEPLLSDGDAVLTHCNAGSLATAQYGTALSIVYHAASKGKRIRVYADETRPLLQGARLTTWELSTSGIDVTLLCDGAAGSLLSAGKVDCVIVGADRIAANGDVANKIGTYPLAVVARENRVPFYVAAPASTFDLSLPTGERIPIEERDPEEVRSPFGEAIAPRGVKVINPAFDVTPARFVTAIITDRGILKPPLEKSISRAFGSSRRQASSRVGARKPL